MKQNRGRVNNRIALWCLVGVIAAVALFWSAGSRNPLNDLRKASIFTAAPAPQSVLLGEGSGAGFSNNEVTQDPTVVKVYVMAGQDAGALVRHYEQTYPSYSYRWHVDYYFPSPGVSGTNLFGQQGRENVAVYIGPAPYKPAYPALSLRPAPSGYATYVTVLVSEKR